MVYTNPMDEDHGEPEEHDGLDALCEFYSVDRSQKGWESLLAKRVYKYTKCGAWIKVDWERRQVVFGSIVEGSDSDCTPQSIGFAKLNSETISAALEEIEAEADILWQEANGNEPE